MQVLHNAMQYDTHTTYDTDNERKITFNELLTCKGTIAQKSKVPSISFNGLANGFTIVKSQPKTKDLTIIIFPAIYSADIHNNDVVSSNKLKKSEYQETVPTEISLVSFKLSRPI